MKVCVATMLALVIEGAAFAQGTVHFGNRVGAGATTSMLTPVYGPNPANPFLMQQGNATTNIHPGNIDYTGHPLLIGTSFTAALFGGAVGTPPEQLTFLGSQPFRTAVTLGGIWAVSAGLDPVVPGVGPGLSAAMQVRAWDNLDGTLLTWAAVMAAPLTVARGASAAFTAGPLGDGSTMAVPANLINMTSFNIAPIPEPGIVALGVLGLGALLLCRRK